MVGVCSGPLDGGWLHLDTVNRAGGHTKLATCAVLGDDCVHELVGTNDGINRAGLYAQCAADAVGLVNHRHQYRAKLPASGVKGLLGLAGQGSYFGYALRATRRAAVN